MKAQERKALEANSLQKGLEQALEGVKQGPSSTLLFWVGAVALIVLAGWLFWWFLSSANDTGSARWMAVTGAAFPSQIDGLLEKPDLKDTPQGRLARFKAARAKLSQGLRELGSKRSSSLELVDEGTKLYEDLLKTAGRVPLLHQEALWGAAKGHEAQGKYDEARKLYERLVKDHASSALGKDAEKRLKRLGDKTAQKDLDDLAKEFGPAPEGRAN
ncbi:MAG: hypothetical protein K2W96_28705 [Gemmataceae bacterium]|nr:hypothetical protein [Gemmataceae bacterium]